MRKKKDITIKGKGRRNMEDIHKSFATNLESLEVFVANLAPVAEKHDKAIRESVEKFAERIMEIIGVPEGGADKQKLRETLEQKSPKQLKQMSDEIAILLDTYQR